MPHILQHEDDTIEYVDTPSGSGNYTYMMVPRQVMVGQANDIFSQEIQIRSHRYNFQGHYEYPNRALQLPIYVHESTLTSWHLINQYMELRNHPQDERNMLDSMRYARSPNVDNNVGQVAVYESWHNGQFQGIQYTAGGGGGGIGQANTGGSWQNQYQQTPHNAHQEQANAINNINSLTQAAGLSSRTTLEQLQNIDNSRLQRRQGYSLENVILDESVAVSPALYSYLINDGNGSVTISNTKPFEKEKSRYCKQKEHKWMWKETNVTRWKECEKCGRQT